MKFVLRWKSTTFVRNVMRTTVKISGTNTEYWRGCNSGLMNLRSAGCYKIAGWCFDFTPYLKRFVVKQYGSWHEYYAPNKTLLRKSLYGTIQKIVEIEAVHEITVHEIIHTATSIQNAVPVKGKARSYRGNHGSRKNIFYT